MSRAGRAGARGPRITLVSIALHRVVMVSIGQAHKVSRPHGKLKVEPHKACLGGLSTIEGVVSSAMILVRIAKSDINQPHDQFET